MTSLVAQMVKHLSTMRETQVQSLGREDPLEKEMATHPSTLAQKIPWAYEPGVHGVAKSRIRLSNFTFTFHTYIHTYTHTHIYIYIYIYIYTHIYSLNETAVQQKYPVFYHLLSPCKILVKEYTRSLIHLLRQLNDTVSTLPPSPSPRNTATN